MPPRAPDLTGTIRRLELIAPGRDGRIRWRVTLAGGDSYLTATESTVDDRLDVNACEGTIGVWLNLRGYIVDMQPIGE